MKQRFPFVMACGALVAATTVFAAPSYLVITVPSGAAGAASVPALLAEWRQTGLVADAWLLDSVPGKQSKAPESNGSKFASLAVLQFPDDSSVDRWQQKAAPAIGAGVITTKVDTLARGETFPRDSTKAIFLVADYDVAASPERYKEYVKGYVVPEMESLRARRILTSYFLPGTHCW
jgi:hypothetical protein